MTYRWVYTSDFKRKLHDVGILPDGTLHNPNNYPEDLVRESIASAQQRRHERRSRAAKEDAKTREERKQLMVWNVAWRMLRDEKIEPSLNCVICGKGLGDRESIARSIGSECWQHVLQAITEMRAAAATPRPPAATGTAAAIQPL
jgi:hypothetical protein